MRCDGMRLDAALMNRRLPATVFPEMPLRGKWSDGSQTETVQEFHAWQAPALLTLTYIADASRSRLEYYACRRPLAVLSVYRLYPKTIQRKLIIKALVEAKIRTANSSTDAS